LVWAGIFAGYGFDFVQRHSGEAGAKGLEIGYREALGPVPRNRTGRRAEGFELLGKGADDAGAGLIQLGLGNGLGPAEGGELLVELAHGEGGGVLLDRTEDGPEARAGEGAQLRAGVIGDAVLLSDLVRNAVRGNAAVDAVGEEQSGIVGVVARDAGQDLNDHSLGGALAINEDDSIVLRRGWGHSERGFVVGVEEEVQAVGEGGAVDGDIVELGVSEERQEEREGAAAEHPAHLIAWGARSINRPPVARGGPDPSGWPKCSLRPAYCRRANGPSSTIPRPDPVRVGK
jgi:hypothetical protein